MLEELRCDFGAVVSHSPYSGLWDLLLSSRRLPQWLVKLQKNFLPMCQTLLPPLHMSFPSPHTFPLLNSFPPHLIFCFHLWFSMFYNGPCLPGIIKGCPAIFEMECTLQKKNSFRDSVLRASKPSPMNLRHLHVLGYKLDSHHFRDLQNPLGKKTCNLSIFPHFLPPIWHSRMDPFNGSYPTDVLGQQQFSLSSEMKISCQTIFRVCGLSHNFSH